MAVADSLTGAAPDALRSMSAGTMALADQGNAAKPVSLPPCTRWLR